MSRSTSDTAEVQALQLKVKYWKKRSENMQKLQECIDQKREKLELKAENPYLASSQVDHINPSVMYIEKPPNFCNDEKIETQNIRKMIINHFDDNWKNWFKVNEFKSLQELQITCSLYNVEEKGDGFNGHKELVAKNMAHIFSGMKNLKHLFLRTEAPSFIHVYSSFQLETADIENQLIFPLSKNSLRELKVSRPMYCFSFKEIFKEFRKLEKLAASVSVGHVSEFEVNKFMVNLEIYFENEDMHIERRNVGANYFLERLLKATPSLKILTLYNKITSSILSFLVHNMTDLRQLICRGGIEEGIDEFYKDMKKNCFGINKDITITVEQTRTWSEEYKLTTTGIEIYNQSE